MKVLEQVQEGKEAFVVCSSFSLSPFETLTQAHHSQATAYTPAIQQCVTSYVWIGALVAGEEYDTLRNFCTKILLISFLLHKRHCVVRVSSQSCSSKSDNKMHFNS